MSKIRKERKRRPKPHPLNNNNKNKNNKVTQKEYTKRLFAGYCCAVIETNK
jgi:hypothetical protein